MISQDNLTKPLLQGRLAHLPPTESDQGGIEVEAASLVADELIKMALRQIEMHRKEVEYWRQVFSQTVPTFSIQPTAAALAALRTIRRKIDTLGEASLVFDINRALISFPEARASAMKEILLMELTADQLITRDFLLVGLLERDQSLSVSDEDFDSIVDLIHKSDIKFSTKKVGKTVSGLLRKLLE